MQAAATKIRQLLVDRSAHKRVLEHPPPRLAGYRDDQAGGLGSLEPFQQPSLFDLAGAPQQSERELGTQDRGKLERRARSVAKALHAAADQAAHAGRGAGGSRAQHGAAVAIGQRAGVAQVPGELLDEERIPERLLQDMLDEALVRFDFDQTFDDRRGRRRGPGPRARPSAPPARARARPGFPGAADRSRARQAGRPRRS